MINSTNKTFNKQANKNNFTGYIGAGNVFSNCQSSSYIRSSKQINCNSSSFDIGCLQNADMNRFNKLFDRLGANSKLFKNRVMHLANENNGIILYFYHHLNKSELIMHGFVVTDNSHKHLLTIQENKRIKSYSILSEVRKIICK